MNEAIIDLNYLWDGWGSLLYCLITCIISGALASIIGIERELHGRPAGVVTHVLIAMACCLLGALSVHGMLSIMLVWNAHTSGLSGNFQVKVDVSRIIAGVVTGVGFLGGGVILKSRASVKGLSTAATIFACAGVGVCCGAGYILQAIITTICIFLIMLLLRRVKDKITKKSPKARIIVKKGHPILGEISKSADERQLVIRSISTKDITHAGIPCLEATITFAYSSSGPMITDLMESVNSDEDVFEIECDGFRKSDDSSNE